MQLLAIVILNQETEKPRQVITKTAGGKRREGPGAMGRELTVSAVQDREGSLKGRQQQQPAYSKPFIHNPHIKSKGRITLLVSEVMQQDGLRFTWDASNHGAKNCAAPLDNWR